MFSAEPTARATAAFNLYLTSLEARLDRQHRSPQQFLVNSRDSAAWNRLLSGELLIESVPSDGATEMPGALLHHWRGTAFIPGATAAEFEQTLRDFASYPKRFAPDVAKVAILREQGNWAAIQMRLMQKHVLTVWLDADYNVTFGELDAMHRYAASRSRSIEEITAQGTKYEHALSAAESHGFLWRQNTYWSWEECENGLLIQIETVSLSRDIPFGLDWALRPYINSVPRNSLTFTLSHVRDALQHLPAKSNPN